MNRTHRRGYGPRTAAATLVLMLAAHAADAQAPASQGAAAHAPGAAASADEIRDIRGPKPLGGGWTVPLVVLAGLLAGAAGYGSWLWSRRRGRRPLTPVEIALERLAAAQTLIAAHDGRAFSIEVSGIVRDYIERQFGLRAAHRTTDEFLHDLVEPAEDTAAQRALAAHRVLAAHRDSLAAFLETCDLAKFGGWNLSAADMETLRTGAVRFVTESAPTPGDTPMSSAVSPSAPLAPSAASDSYAAFPST